MQSVSEQDTWVACLSGPSQAEAEGEPHDNHKQI